MVTKLPHFVRVQMMVNSALMCINKIVLISQKLDFAEKSNFYAGVNLLIHKSVLPLADGSFNRCRFCFRLPSHLVESGGDTGCQPLRYQRAQTVS